MYFENHLTEADMVRVHQTAPNPPPPTLLAGSYLSLLEAIDIFTRESVNPVVRGLLAPTSREQVILGLYFRSIAYCKTATELKSVAHQQSLTSAERSVIELYVDMELIHRDKIDDGVVKFGAFTDWQKLGAARRIDRFYADNPGLDRNPSRAARHRAFITSDAARIEAEVERVWGRTAEGKLVKPEHWSGKNLIDRSKVLDKDVEFKVIKDYDRRNFSVHTGLAGFLNLSQANFEAMCAIALKLIGECMLAELHIIGQELKLMQAIQNYDDILAEIDRVETFAFASKVLQSQGEPSRYCVHPGAPGV